MDGTPPPDARDDPRRAARARLRLRRMRSAFRRISVVASALLAAVVFVRTIPEDAPGVFPSAGDHALHAGLAVGVGAACYGFFQAVRLLAEGLALRRFAGRPPRRR